MVNSTDTAVDTVTPVLDLGKAIKLRLVNHLSYQAIGDQLGVSKQAVHQALHKLANMMDNPALVASFRENKAVLLESVQMEIVSNMLDQSKLKSASVNNLAYAASQLNTMIKLERDEATSIIDNRSLELSLKANLADLNKFLQARGMDSVDLDDVLDVDVDDLSD